MYGVFNNAASTGASMELAWKMAAIYLSIGLLISFVGGAFKPLTEQRTAAVATIQVLFLLTLWLPAMMWHAIKGVGR